MNEMRWRVGRKKWLMGKGGGGGLGGSIVATE